MMVFKKAKCAANTPVKAGDCARSIESAIREGNVNFVLLDRDNTLSCAYESVLATHGYEILRFDTAHLERCDCFNPLDERYVYDEETASLLADNLVKHTYSGEYTENSLFWENSERMVYMALLGYLSQHIRREDRNMRSVMKLLELASSSEECEYCMSALDFLFNELETGKRLVEDGVPIDKWEVKPPSIYEDKQKPRHTKSVIDSPEGTRWVRVSAPVETKDDFSLRCYKNLIKADVKTLKMIFANARVRLNLFNIDKVLKATDTDVFHFDTLCDPSRKTAIMVSASSVKPMYDPLVRLLVHCALTSLSTELEKDALVEKSAKPVCFYYSDSLGEELVDDFAKMHSAPFNHLISLEMA